MLVENCAIIFTPVLILQQIVEVIFIVPFTLVVTHHSITRLHFIAVDVCSVHKFIWSNLPIF